jgi:hypothetical protein
VSAHPSVSLPLQTVRSVPQVEEVEAGALVPFEAQGRVARSEFSRAGALS